MKKNFTSDITLKTYPISTRISGKTLRPSILQEIRKDYPDFTGESFLSLSELNFYRHKFMESFLDTEIKDLTSLEKNVVETIRNNETLTVKLEEPDKLTGGQKLADKVATFGGSWRFIIFFAVFIAFWILVNVFFFFKRPFDPYPFILLNLILSCLAALQAPVIMMSQNRQEEKDRDRAKKDYMINLKSEIEIRMLHEKIDHLIIHQQQQLLEIQQIQIEMMNDIMETIKK